MLLIVLGLLIGASCFWSFGADNKSKLEVPVTPPTAMGTPPAASRPLTAPAKPHKPKKFKRHQRVQLSEEALAKLAASAKDKDKK